MASSNFLHSMVDYDAWSRDSLRLLAVATFCSCCAGYLLLVRSLRYQRRNYHDSLCPGELSRMSVESAQIIYLSLLKLEFPYAFGLGLAISLFETYAIPTMAKLLHATSRVSSPRTSDKRHADLLALIVGFTQQPYGSDEWTEAMARLNAIHGHYLDQGKILMDDMRYSLAVSMIDAVRWADAIEWRKLSPVEVCANGVFWKALGDAQGITWDGLASKEWRNGIHFLEELGDWSDAYAAKNHILTRESGAIAKETLSVFVGGLPPFMRPATLTFLAALMDERTRRSVGVAAPPHWMHAALRKLWIVRAFLLRHLALPRPARLSVEMATGVKEANRFHLLDYTRKPWYVKPTVWNRYGPPAWMCWYMGLPVPGDAKYMPGGFDPKTTGPPIGRGSQTAHADLVRKRVEARGKCPFAGVR